MTSHIGVKSPRLCWKAIAQGWRECRSRVDFEIEGYDATADCVVATVHERYVGRASEVEVDRHHYALWTLRDGKVTRMRVYLDRDEAFEAAGLSE